MPSPELYTAKKGFDMSVGQVYGSYKITKLDVGENKITTYHEYHYPTSVTMEYQGKGTPTEDEAIESVRAFQNHIGSAKIIDSGYGHPYRCVAIWSKEEGETGGIVFDEDNDRKTLTMKFTGRGVRMDN